MIRISGQDHKSADCQTARLGGAVLPSSEPLHRVFSKFSIASIVVLILAEKKDTTTIRTFDNDLTTPYSPGLTPFRRSFICSRRNTGADQLNAGSSQPHSFRFRVFLRDCLPDYRLPRPGFAGMAADAGASRLIGHAASTSSIDRTTLTTWRGTKFNRHAKMPSSEGRELIRVYTAYRDLPRAWCGYCNHG